MMLHENFEWDENKANKNLEKHHVPLTMRLSCFPTKTGIDFTLRNTTPSTVRLRTGT
jgi:uncharacterized DUF497 family protein